MVAWVRTLVGIGVEPVGHMGREPFWGHRLRMTQSFYMRVVLQGFRFRFRYCKGAHNFSVPEVLWTPL